MGESQSEIQRTLDRVEIREKLNLELDITEEEYQSSHEVEGLVRGVVTPDSKVERARKFPPVSILERAVAAATNSESLARETGYPGTEFYIGVVRGAPTKTEDADHQEGLSRQMFSVEGLPDDDTIKLEKDWTVAEVEDALANNERKGCVKEYSINRYPRDQLPVVVRGKIHRDAREYYQNREERRERKKRRARQQSANRQQQERRVQQNSSVVIDDDTRQRIRHNARQYEGLAALSIEVEYRGDSPEAEVGSNETFIIDNFRAEMESTFPDITFGDEDGDRTYNPEQQRVEWRGRSVGKGRTTEYDIFGPYNELIDIGKVTASFRGEIRNDTLTGTRIVGIYDKTGTPLSSYNRDNTQTRHTISLKGNINIDPRALAGDAQTHTTADIAIEEHPEDAFERLQAVCQQEGITILDLQNLGEPEPVRGQEGVFEITAGESGAGADRAGRMEVKREFGDEGVVYADIQVTGRFTAMSKESQISVSDESGDRVVRSDEGGLETRGKTTAKIKTRSASSDLNAEFINKIEKGLRGQDSGRWGPDRDSERQISSEIETELESNTDRTQELPPETPNKSSDYRGGTE
jgi:hypothetical protein